MPKQFFEALNYFEGFLVLGHVIMVIYILRFLVFRRHHKLEEAILRYYIGYLYKAYCLFWGTFLVSAYLFDND